MCVSFRFVFGKNIKIKIKIGGRRSHGGHAAEGKRARDREKEEVSTTKAFISINSGVLRAEICHRVVIPLCGVPMSCGVNGGVQGEPL